MITFPLEQAVSRFYSSLCGIIRHNNL